MSIRISTPASGTYGGYLCNRIYHCHIGEVFGSDGDMRNEVDQRSRYMRDLSTRWWDIACLRISCA